MAIVDVPDLIIFELVIVGWFETGKTTFTGRFKDGVVREYYDDYHATKVAKVSFDTDVDGVYIETRFHIWDHDGINHFKKLEDDVPRKCAVVMFDFTSTISIEKIEKWIAEVRTIRPDIPIVIVGNKYDLVDEMEALTTCQKIWERFDVDDRRDVNVLQVVPMSVKTDLNITSPFLLFLSREMGRDDLELF